MEREKTNQKSEAALREERILEFWRENKTFEKSLEKTKGKKEFVFYEGPPTANGIPGIHHLEARAFKDAIPRYKTMRGYHVRRKGGWDTHGLPVELQVEKSLGLDSKKAIEDYGIEKFNQKCKESVWEYLDIWNKFTERIGFWVDQKNPYVTYHNEYIESLWNIVKKVSEQNLLYKDYKVVPWCPRCGTALSSHELAQGYEDVKDLSVYVKFKVIASPDAFAQSLGPSAKASATPSQKHPSSAIGDTYILAWTTTPWTLPGNVALAVGKDIDYVKIKTGDGFYYLAKDRLAIIEGDYNIVEELKGSNLVGLEYEPLYLFLADAIFGSEKQKLGKAYKVYPAGFVTTEDGTGVVHTAVMYGQDDFELGTQVGLPKHHLVGLDGKFLPGTGFLEGKFVRDEDVAVDIIKDLASRGLLLKKEKYEHSYPHCWRCKTALIYYARDSWYIKMSNPQIKQRLIDENKKINWEPEHIRDGRFGEWLREIKDWAISRERYWGTPLPVWTCESCKKIEVIGGLADLKEKTKKSGNKYFVMRHGESDSNTTSGGGLVSSRVDSMDHLTAKGKEQVLGLVQKLKEKGINLVIYSDLPRTKETAELLKEKLNLVGDDLVPDKRLREINAGVLDGKTWDEYGRYRGTANKYFYTPEGGESFKIVKLKTAELMFDVERKYQGKNILFVTHELTARMLFAAIDGLDDIATIKKLKELPRLKNAEVLGFDFVPLPHNENYELDLHRPYIDEARLVCSCGGDLKRTKEVMDVWFDSGAMPFAQDHYPFENKKWVDGSGYPADFISEAIDQTRGWFYTLHAIGVLMGRGRAYRHVICLGHLLDAKGKKMSKSVGNVVDPWAMMDKYGVDTLRLWMYSINQPGESKNFEEKTVALLHSQVFGLLYNVFAFYELYRDEALEKDEKVKSDNILDIWILARLDELTKNATDSMENYRLLEPTRSIREFIGDLSTWYLRRSRERIKDGDREAKATLYHVLKTLVKLMAPFAPFSAEDIWQKLKNERDEESVHLAEWPGVDALTGNLKKYSKFLIDKFFGKGMTLAHMKKVRSIVTLGLEARQKAGIKVRQPLERLEARELNLKKEFIDLIKDEINVKRVEENENLETEVLLDTRITRELKEEGTYRELVRALQEMRKTAGLTPKDIVSLTVEADEIGRNLIQKFESEMKKTVLLSQIEFADNDGNEVKLDEFSFKVKIGK